MRGKKILIWLVALIVVLACVPTFRQSLPPTAGPGAVNTFIVQTAHAAASETAQALPSSSPTATETPAPRNTASPSPTATTIVVFLLPGSASSLSAPTLAGITSGTSKSNYGCKLLSTEPTEGTEFAPRTDFIATWAVKNIGKKDWFRATTSYVYVSGDKLHKVTSYSIPKGAETGKNVLLTVDMETFKNPGTYRTTWAMFAENTFFCPLTLTIVVK